MRSKLVALIILAGLLLINLSGASSLVQAALDCSDMSASGTDAPPNDIPVGQGQTFSITLRAPGAIGVDWSGTFISQPFSGAGIDRLTFSGTAASGGVWHWSSINSISTLPWQWSYSVSGGCLSDGRINPDLQASIVGYCTDNHGIETYLPNGRKLFTASAEQIKSALTRATSSKRHVLIKQDAGQQLWALKSNELQFHNALGEKYDFIFPADRC